MAIARTGTYGRSEITTGSSIVVTLNVVPVIGRTLVLVFGAYNITSTTISSIADGNGKITWTMQKTAAASGIYCEIWVGVVNNNGASVTQTVTLSASIASGYSATADIYEYSGLLTTGFLDKTASSTGSGAPAVPTGTTAATTVNDELWVGAVIGFSNPPVSATTPINGFALLDGVANGYISTSFLEKIVSLTGAANSGVTIGTPYYYAACIATFKVSPASIISGVTRNSSGGILGSCTVLLFRTSDKVYMGSIVSDASTGAYSFGVGDTSTQYFVVAFKAGSPDVQGTTDNNLVGV